MRSGGRLHLVVEQTCVADGGVGSRDEIVCRFVVVNVSKSHVVYLVQLTSSSPVITNTMEPSRVYWDIFRRRGLGFWKFVLCQERTSNISDVMKGKMMIRRVTWGNVGPSCIFYLSIVLFLPCIDRQSSQSPTLLGQPGDV